MNENIIKFYLMANSLKTVLRTGWLEVGITNERIESVAEHVYGCFVLAVSLCSEYKLDLKIDKVFKMILLNELCKAKVVDEKLNKKEKVMKMLSPLLAKNEYISLFDELAEQKTKEAIFVNKLCKIESDLQAKIYDLKGEFDLDKALKDVENYPVNLVKEIKPLIKNASDGWILFNRQFYEGDVLFENLSHAIQRLEEVGE